MCINRNWKSLTSSKAGNVIFATRSDEVIIRIDTINFVGVTSKPKAVLSFVHTLESYRNCNCSQTTPCDLHKQKGENKSARTN